MIGFEYLRASLLISSILCPFWNNAIASCDDRIIDGCIARRNQFPWHVSIIGSNDVNMRQLCGGSLIARDWIATAAHCVLNRRSLNLGFGSRNLTDPELAYENVTEYYIHPGYDKKLKHHDIALIKLPTPIKENDFIRRIALPNSTDYMSYDREVGRVVGFGRYIEDSEVVSRTLRWTSLQVISNGECARIYGDEVVVPSIMCASSVRNSSRNTCGGDSGGSLILFEDGRYILAGIISFAVNNKCGSKYPSGFMRIRPHMNWIRRQMNGQRS